MSRRKGLSHEEKRSKMLELFYEKKDFFMLKELEKMAPKEKGVISQAVKDVVQSLVDDNLVDTDKIGTCVYFWAFPSKASNELQARQERLEEQLSSLEEKLQDVKSKTTQAKSGREDTEERRTAVSSLESVKLQHEQLQQQLQHYADSDPHTLKLWAADAKVAVEAANRWTDNIFSIKSWCKNKFYIEEDVINKQFNIPEELEYIDQ
uniref:Meiotic nuclear division protein 1 homolog n=1 Tax=Hirondellea gigas TaxID=1518452 RepID=A0A2P2HYM8_9CRUS